MSSHTNFALAMTLPEELVPTSSHAVEAVPSDHELERLDEAIAAIDVQLAGSHHNSLSLGDRREQLLSGRTDLRRKRERAGLLEAGELVNFYGIDYVGTVAQYFDPDPNLMRGDGMRQRWPEGALEKILGLKPRRP